MERTPPPAPAPAPAPAAAPKASAKDEPADDFESAFGGGSKKAAPKPEAAPEPASSKPKNVYIPPAAGSAPAEVKNSLETSDVMEVVLSNKAALANCVQEQKKREPGISGKLVMKWTIQTSGRTSNVSVVSEEFKGTYLAGCIGGLIKTWSFPRHKVQGDPVSFPFKF